MLRRIESEERLLERPALGLAGAPEVALPPPHEALGAGEDVLPQGHPKWVRDGVSISQRARDAIARLRPVALRVLHFWDHGVRAILVAGRRVRIDPSGCYRAE